MTKADAKMCGKQLNVNFEFNIWHMMFINKMKTLDDTASAAEIEGNNDEKRLLRWIPCKLEYFHAFYTHWMCVINVRNQHASKRYIKAENRFVKQTYLNENASAVDVWMNCIYAARVKWCERWNVSTFAMADNSIRQIKTPRWMSVCESETDREKPTKIGQINLNTVTEEDRIQKYETLM